MDGGWFSLKDAKLYTRARVAAEDVRLARSGPRPRGSPGASATGCGPSATPRRRRRSSTPTGRPATTTAGAGEIILQTGMRLGGERGPGDRRRQPLEADVARRDLPRGPPRSRRTCSAGADEQMNDEEFAKEGFIISSDPEEHIERIRQIEEIGPTTICLQLIGQADPMGTIKTYGEKVLPALRGAAVAADGVSALAALADLERLAAQADAADAEGALVAVHARDAGHAAAAGHAQQRRRAGRDARAADGEGAGEHDALAAVPRSATARCPRAALRTPRWAGGGAARDGRAGARVGAPATALPACARCPPRHARARRALPDPAPRRACRHRRESSTSTYAEGEGMAKTDKSLYTA